MVPRAIIGDGRRAVAEALALALRSHLEVVAVATTATDAVAAIRAKEPKVVIVDAALPEIGGLDVIRRASTGAIAHAIGYVVLADDVDRELALDAARLGVRGFALRQSPLEQLALAVRAAARGERYFDPSLGELFAPGRRASATRLSEREKLVLSRIADGMSNAEIGRELALAPDTVRTYIRRAMEKLGAKTRTHAVALALRRSLIS
jgi:DNA-binding NarL/FixJ family response regulator